MNRCGKCDYKLVNDRCPICCGRKLRGLLGKVFGDQLAYDEPRSAQERVEPLPLYWSPRP